MNRLTLEWDRLTRDVPPVGWVDTLLRGTGQVMFQNNALTGLLFLVGIFYNSWRFGLAALLGLAVGTAAAVLLGADRALIRNGLFGFNAILVGIGLTFFLEDNWGLVGYIILGAVVSTVVMMGLLNLLSAWDIGPLTAPFVLTTWLLLAAVFQFQEVRPEAIVPAPLDPEAEVQTELRELEEAEEGGITAENLAHAFFRGVGEVMFQDDLVTGLIFLIAILVNSRISAAFAALGSALGGLTALALGANGFWIYHGLYGFNSVLTGIALGGLFFVLTWRSAIYAALGAIAAAGAMAGISVFLSPLGLPALTGPFVIVTWLFLFPKAGFRALQPVSLARVSTPEEIRRIYLVERGAGPGTAPSPP
jgi:urea transporter